MNSHTRITELDALRGMAALMVTVYHFLLGRVPHDSIAKFGTTGVDLFFIISGFVIFMTIERCKTAKEFIVGRFSRLYPAYWICVTITFILIFVSLKMGYHQDQKNNLLGVYVMNLTMLQYYFNIRDLDGQYWTLIVELVFYVFILLLFISNMLKNIKKIGTGILLFLLLWRLFYTSSNNTFLLKSLFDFIPLLKYFPLFFTGILFYDSYNKKLNNKTNIILIIFCYVVQVMIFSQFHRHVWILNTFEFALILLIYFVLFFMFIYGKLRWISNRYTIALGEISYCLYLIHNFMGAKAIMPFLMKKAGLSLWASSIIAFAIVLIAATLIHKLVEKPAMLAIRKKVSWKI